MNEASIEQLTCQATQTITRVGTCFGNQLKTQSMHKTTMYGQITETIKTKNHPYNLKKQNVYSN